LRQCTRAANIGQSFFTFAAGKGWIDANPLTDIKLPKKKPTDDRAPKVQQDFIRWLQTDGLDAYSAAYAKAAELVLADGRKGYKKRNELTISPKKTGDNDVFVNDNRIAPRRVASFAPL
jgi:hypothetical protein